MRIEDILKKQGKIYKNLTTNKTIQNYNEKIKPPKDGNTITYERYISKGEASAIAGLEKLLDKKITIFAIDETLTGDHSDFEILIDNGEVIYLKIAKQNLKRIPKQVNYLQNILFLFLNDNQIQKIENLYNLQALKAVTFDNNQITKIENLDNLKSLELLHLDNNQITKIENLYGFPRLVEVDLRRNLIIKTAETLEEIKKLRSEVELVYI